MALLADILYLDPSTVIGLINPVATKELYVRASTLAQDSKGQFILEYSKEVLSLSLFYEANYYIYRFLLE